MGFTEIEQTGKKIFEQFPVVKRSFKRLYQIASVVAVGERVKYEGDLKRVSPNDGYEYFYGYYDKSPWDADDRFMIAVKVKMTYKSVAPKEPGKVVLIDTKNGNKTIGIGMTHAWNVQQSCMAQWLGPDFKSHIIYNDFRQGKYCSVIYDVEHMREERTLPLPVYDVSRDGSTALSLDFSRLHRMRPGYGYSNIPDCSQGKLCPDETCIWKMSIASGQVENLLKYTDLASFEPNATMLNAEHKVNHLMINPNGSRFMVLHRWFKKGRKHTRLVTVNIDGTEMYNLSDDVFVSHCYWKNDNEILSFLRKKENGDHYYLMKDKTHDYRMYWPELNTDGHCSYSPDGKYIVTDTYPNRNRIASVYICTEKNNYCGRIARVYSPFKYDNDCRCDLHPRWNRTGDKICIDSVHEGIRALYVIDLSKRNFIPLNSGEEIKTVTVLMATYNGEKYLREQMDSLDKQENINVKVLVRDDGSSDETVQILEEWKNKIDLKCYSQGHLGVPQAYYDLLKKATEDEGEYYAFCDQDDLWDSDKLSIAINELRKLPTDLPAIYYCGQRLVDQDLNHIKNHFLNVRRTMRTRFVISDIAGCTAVFNRALLNKVTEYEPNYMLMHDSWIFKVCLAVGGKAIIDENCHISYRQHESNTAGINMGLVGRFKQMYRYVFRFKIQRQLMELNRGYKNEIVPEYKEIINTVINYKKSISLTRKLLDKQFIDFHNRGLNFVFHVKVLIKQL